MQRRLAQTHDPEPHRLRGKPIGLVEAYHSMESLPLHSSYRITPGKIHITQPSNHYKTLHITYRTSHHTVDGQYPEPTGKVKIEKYHHPAITCTSVGGTTHDFLHSDCLAKQSRQCTSR